MILLYIRFECNQHNKNKVNVLKKSFFKSLPCFYKCMCGCVGVVFCFVFLNQVTAAPRLNVRVRDHKQKQNETGE